MSYLSDEDYNFIYSNSPRICVDLVIKKGDSILLTKRDQEPYNGFWHTPGGRIRFRETIEDAIKRIAKTEVGMSVDRFNFLGVCEFLHEVQDGNPRHSITMYYQVSGGDVCNGDFFEWLPDNTIPEQKQFINSLNIGL